MPGAVPQKLYVSPLFIRASHSSCACILKRLMTGPVGSVDIPSQSRSRDTQHGELGISAWASSGWRVELATVRSHDACQVIDLVVADAIECEPTL